MKIIIDTSSLIHLVRYYLPFEQETELSDFIQSKFEAGDLILIDAIYNECRSLSGGLIMKKMDYLKNKDFKNKFKIPINTQNLLPPSPKKFNNLLENSFRTPLSLSKRLNDAEFEVEKQEFLKSADAKMIIYALNEKNKTKNKTEEMFGNDICIVTEETKAENDNKVFRKIPKICEILEIKVMTLPELLKDWQDIDIKFNIS